MLVDSRTWDLQLHYFILGDIEAGYSLGKQCQISAYISGPEHVSQVVRIERPVLPISEAEAVQIDIPLVGEPNGRHSNFFGGLRGNRKQGISAAHLILFDIDLDGFKPICIGDWVVKDIRIRNESSFSVSEIFFGFGGQTTIGVTAVSQLTLFPSGCILSAAIVLQNDSVRRPYGVHRPLGEEARRG